MLELLWYYHNEILLSVSLWEKIPYKYEQQMRKASFRGCVVKVAKGLGQCIGKHPECQ